MYHPINRTALGRVARIGALYDVRTETFLPDLLFDTNFHEESVSVLELGDSSVELVMSDSIQDKFYKLDIEAELHISLLSDLVKLSGSGAYFNEDKKSARTQSMALVYKIRTFNEEFMLRHNADRINKEILQAGLPATHVVVGIDWGAVCSITCLRQNTEGKDETTITDVLSAHLEKLKTQVSAKGSARVDYEDTNKEQLDQFTYKCASYVLTTDRDLPTTFEGALKLAKSLPEIVKKTNNGKGVPVLYVLMPLQTVAKMRPLQVTLELHYSNIREDTIKQSAQVMESIVKKRHTLFDIQNDLHALDDYVAESSLSTIKMYMKSIADDEPAFKRQLKELVRKIRCKEADVSYLNQFLSHAMATFVKYDGYIRQFQGDLNNINLIRNWQKRGIIYLGKNDELIIDNVDAVYVLYKRGFNADEAPCQQNEEFFLRFQQAYSQQCVIIFKVVNKNITPHLWKNRPRKAIIEEFRNGHPTCLDFYEKEGKYIQMCLVKNQETRLYHLKPIEIAVVKIRCPNSISGKRKCSGAAITWSCAKCKQPMEYGLKTFMFYCRCGQSKPSKSFFRCNENVHRIDYIAYPEDKLFDELGTLRAMEEKNILILGETGVGKSTWINGIVNYLSFSDLNEAREADDPIVLIPSQFKYTKESGETFEINIGEVSDNEVLEDGQSATQEPRSYVFYVGDQTIRLIDTPGIGDLRGIEQDRINFDKILSYLSRFKEIHAVVSC